MIVTRQTVEFYLEIFTSPPRAPDLAPGPYRGPAGPPRPLPGGGKTVDNLDLLMGVGQDATDQGRRLGSQVSVFEVSDPANPKLLQKLSRVAQCSF